MRTLIESGRPSLRAARRWAWLALLGYCASTQVVAQDGPLRLVSYGAPGILGKQGNRPVSLGRSALSADGRYVAFETASNNLVADDHGRIKDVFVADRSTGELNRISARPDGVEANGDSGAAAISGDGRWVAFESRATDLVENGPSQGIYLHDRDTGETRLLTSLLPDDTNAGSSSPAISADGGIVAFTSGQRLVAADTDDFGDVYIYRRAAGTLELASRRPDGTLMGWILWRSVSVSSDGRFVCFATYSLPLSPEPSYGLAVRDLATGAIDVPLAPSGMPASSSFSDVTSISGDGRFIAFGTEFALLPIDGNQRSDVYLFDRITREFELISVSSSGAISDRASRAPSLSADGMWVAFASYSSTFAPDADGTAEQIYVRRRASGSTQLVSRSIAGMPLSGSGVVEGSRTAISSDGTAIAFASNSDSLVKADTNRRSDAFVAEVANGTLARVSVSGEAPRVAGGTTRNLETMARGFASADGSRVAFNTRDDNLVLQRRGGVLRFDVATGSMSDAVGFGLPGSPDSHVLVLEGISDDGGSVLFRREPPPYEGVIGTPPPLPSPRDLWLSSPTQGSGRVDNAPMLPANSTTPIAVMSADARSIAFVSEVAWNDPDGNTSGVYVRAWPAAVTVRIDTTPLGPATASARPMLGLSRNGRYVAFVTAASGIVPDAFDGRLDLFLHDLYGGGYTRVVHPQSAGSLVTPYSSGRIEVSDDGNILVLASDNPDLLPDVQAALGLFRLDRANATLIRLSAHPDPNYHQAREGSMSVDGRRVAFEVPAADGANSQIHLFDADAASTRVVSVDAAQRIGDGYSFAPTLTADGATLVFTTTSANWAIEPRVVGDLDVVMKSLDVARIFRSGFE